MAVVLDSLPPAAPPPSSLAPGFRFHPTDEELVRYYLRRKICGKPFRFDAISDVDVYKVEPWDLPGLSRLKSRDLEWYFFSVLDKKYGNGSRTNRATDRGYWKTTGKDRSVYHRSQLVGMKKTLVYHSGRAPKGERTNWVMHEYRLIDQELEKAGLSQDAFVLCRIFRKSGSGPKNGEQYGAPFVEEEWEDDELVMVPKQESAEELPVDDDDAYLDASDLEQILGSDMPDEDGPLPLNYHQGNDVSCGDVSTEIIDETENFLVDGVEDQPQDDKEDEPKLFDLPVQNEMDPKSVKHEYIGETNNTMDFDVDYLLDEPFFDASTGDFQFDGTSFFEADDVKNDVKTEPGLDMFDEYAFFNPTMDNLGYTFDSPTLENTNEQTHQVSEISQQLFEGQNNDFTSSKLEHPDLATCNLDGTQVSEESWQLFEGQNNNGASSSNQDSATGSAEETHESQLFEEHCNDLAISSKQEDADLPTEFAYPFFKKASCMLDNISGPPAFSSAKYLASASQASTSVRVTTGMIRIQDISFTGSKMDWSMGKHGQLNIVLSFGLEQNDDNYSLRERKGDSRSWLYCLFVWIMVLSLSLKMSSLICPRSYMS
ncbi:hypothetical protein OSB04_026634 [Centaurea solstitialis]|uniref:NAC domain-containing protein n=1 Tax=Centaurea solstitialis TaxID=347529 RepID=A0AA38SXA7_9ASTR|nr:hypothetical protein OSB04_026634 [Centaurea solstitialis]